MATTEFFPIAIPLIFLVILKLTDISRSIDLQNTSNTSWDPLILPRKSVGDYELGRFTLLHGFTSIILFFVFGLTISDGIDGRQITSIVNIGIGVFTGVFLILLPLFEVQGYDQHPLNDKWKIPNSFGLWITRITVTLISFAVIIVSSGLARSIESTLYSLLLTLVTIGSFLVGLYFWSNANREFFHFLSSEVDSLNEE